MTALTISHVAKTFGRDPVLRDVSLTVPAGTRTAIVGASGSGKSTLLRLIAGFERADAGEIRLGDRTLTAPAQFVPAHRRGIGYVAQDGALFPHLSVEENIRFGLRRPGRHASRVREVMDLTSLDPALIGRYPHQLSGGQQQRVAVARALAPGPRVILLDEPFSALDTGLRELTRRAVVDALERSAVTTVLVTHDQDEALSFGHEVGIIDGGRIVQSGPPAAVFDDPATVDIATFLGAAVLLPAALADGHADCAVGRIPVRHDRSGGGRRAQALLRPDQIRLSPGPANAIVDSVQPRGSHARVTVRTMADEATRITVRIPVHEAADYRAGMPVSVGVTGGCVLYPPG